LKPISPHGGSGQNLLISKNLQEIGSMTENARLAGKTSMLASWLGTALVAVRAVPLVLHSAAHVELKIFLPSVLANVYIWVVLFIAPVVAAVLLWTSAARVGAWLLFWSMLGSLMFELYNHFMVMSPDHVSQVPDTFWGHMFQITAAATAILEAAGCAIAVYFLCGPLRRAAAFDLTERNSG
jgi:hypothetical protein